jgi:hypothetical protein
MRLLREQDLATRWRIRYLTGLDLPELNQNASGVIRVIRARERNTGGKRDTAAVCNLYLYTVRVELRAHASTGNMQAENLMFM